MKKLITSLLLVINLVSYSQVINVDSVKYYLVELINEHRVKKGLGVLSYDDTLEISAERHTQYMVTENVLSHDELNKNNPYYTGHSVFDRSCQDEICFKGTLNFVNNKNVAIMMFKTWCKSPAHYSAIINKNLKFFGIGLSPTTPSKELKLFIMTGTITFNP